MTKNEIFLAHHGIKNQKWGVRRFQNPDGSYTEEGKKRYGKAKEKLSDITKPITESIARKKRNREYEKNRSSMSDKDLNAAIDRLKKEKQLREMIHPGRTYAKEIIKNVGQKVLTTAAVGIALYSGKQFAAQILSNPELGNAIFNGGPKKK